MKPDDDGCRRKGLYAENTGSGAATVMLIQERQAKNKDEDHNNDADDDA